jgi:putative salt-induced outer membrane protein
MQATFIIRIAALAAILGSASLSAQDEEAPKYGWSGKGELGLVSASGNSDNRSLNLAMEFIYEAEKWRHRLSGGAIYAEDNGKKTANRYDLGAQSDYKLSEKSYVFGAARYENDDFSAFEDQTTVTFGYGRHLLDNARHKLKVEAGAGYRTASVASTGKSEDGVIFRGLLDWAWQLTASTSLGERYLVESGSDNTYMQNDLGLTVAINSRLALKMGYQVRNNSDVPAGVKKTDTLTSANLVYHF